MNTIDLIRQLVAAENVLLSVHGYDKLGKIGLAVDEIIAGVPIAHVVEDYPTFHKGPAVLVLQYDMNNQPIHVVWGIAKGTQEPAVLVTVYRPDPMRWSGDFLRRIK